MTVALVWGIKASLIGYITALDDGEVELEPPAERRGDVFRFPAPPGAAGRSSSREPSGFAVTGACSTSRFERRG